MNNDMKMVLALTVAANCVVAAWQLDCIQSQLVTCCATKLLRNGLNSHGSDTLSALVLIWSDIFSVKLTAPYPAAGRQGQS